MKKFFIFLLLIAVFCIGIFATDSIEIPYRVPDRNLTLFYFGSNGDLKSYEFPLEYVDSLSNYSYTIDTFDAMDQTASYGKYHHVGNLSFSLILDDSVYRGLELSDYELTVFFQIHALNEGNSYVLDPDEVLGLQKHMLDVKNYSALSCPDALTILRQSSVAAYSNYSQTYMMDGSSLYGSYTFPSFMTESLLSSSSASFFVPAYLSTETEIQVILSLEKAAEQTNPPETSVPDDPDVPDKPEIYEPQGQGTFVDPLIYSYDYNFYINETKGSILDSYSVTDIYNDGFGYKFRDYSDKYTISAQALMSHQYDVFLAIGRTDTESDSFVDSVCELFTVELPCDEDRLEKPDISKSGFRMEWYFATVNDWTFENFKDNIETINSSFYGLEPFSVTLGDITIPYDYFTYVYLPSSDTFKVILEFDGAKAEHRIFMNAFLGQDSITMTFTCDWYLDDGLLMGITQSGFYCLYDDDGEPLPDAPSDDNNGGYTQEDIDNARLEGYWQGVGESVDKNYIFGYVNGLFNSLYNGWDIIGNGISIGGTTLAECVYSILIIMALVAFAKWVL